MNGFRLTSFCLIEGGFVLKSRIGVVGIVVGNPARDAALVNHILSEYASVIVGRMGIPYRERKLSVIALTVDGDNDTIGAMTGKLGQLDSVVVKSALTPETVS
jgi:putative iron-only hydrogenase system regulator